jgi:hypothetical protein
MFDPFKQAKLQNSYQSLKEYNPAPEKDMSLDELKRLSGNGSVTGENTIEPDTHSAAKKAQFMKENNIKPGTEAWFKLWYAKPKLTGEDPFSKK